MNFQFKNNPQETISGSVDDALITMEQGLKKDESKIYNNLRRAALVAAASLSLITVGCGKEESKAEAKGKPAVEQTAARNTNTSHGDRLRAQLREEEMKQRLKDERLHARARQLAKEMRIEMGKSFEIKTAGNTVIEINGIIVPESLLTKDEIEHIETAELLSGKKLYNPDIKSNRGLESGNVKNSSGGYERGSDFGIEKNNTHNW